MGAASAQGAPGDDGEPLAGLRGRRDERVGIRARKYRRRCDVGGHGLETGRNRREYTWRPPAEGLYDPSASKRTSCGVGFIANIKGKKSHQIVTDALSILCNLEHRGAVGADPRAGDGAGILVQIPHAFFARKAAELGFELPKPGEYAVG